MLSTARDEAHSLSGPSAVVWRSVCDGTRPALPDEEVNTAVEALLDLGLLARPVGLSRRRVLQGGVVVTAVGISTIALPTVAAAASGNQSYGTRGSGAVTEIEQGPANLILPVNARNIVVTLVGAAGGAGGDGNRGAAFSPFGDGTEVTWTLGRDPRVGADAGLHPRPERRNRRCWCPWPWGHWLQPRCDRRFGRHSCWQHQRRRRRGRREHRGYGVRTL